jgi:methyltransferase-like protein 6
LDRDFDVIKTLVARYTSDRRPIRMLECGCGVGNAFYPLVAKYPCLRVVGIDLSARAVQLIKEHPLYSTGQVQAFVKDAVKDGLTDVAHDMDFAVMLFMASALSPHQMLAAFKHVHETLRGGGMVGFLAALAVETSLSQSCFDCVPVQLLFRDYGRYDAAQLRFRGKHKLAENLYVRQDGTRAYFFDTADLTKLAVDAGFEVLEIRAICRTYVNRKEGVGVPRVWMHARFQKPASHA